MLSPSAPENGISRTQRVGVRGRAVGNVGTGATLRGCRIGTPSAGVCGGVESTQPVFLRAVVPQILVHSPGVSNQHPRTAFCGSGNLPGPVVGIPNDRTSPYGTGRPHIVARSPSSRNMLWFWWRTSQV